MGRRLAGVAVALLLGPLVGGCGGKAPAPKQPAAVPEPAAVEPEAEPEAEAVETGKDCVTATATCQGGVCDVEVDNGCKEPVTCAVEILALCRGANFTGEARGKARDTFAVGDKGVMQGGADCQGSAVAGTQVDTMSCK